MSEGWKPAKDWCHVAHGFEYPGSRSLAKRIDDPHAFNGLAVL